MSDIKNSEEQKQYWSHRYQEQQTGWDIGYPSTPLTDYFDQLENKALKILIPGAGNSYEAEYLYRKGFHQTHILDIAPEPIETFKQRVPEFPEHQIIQANFFDHQSNYDLIIEQTFFCSFVPTPENRKLYALKMHDLLMPEGKLVGVWFDLPLTGEMTKRPFGGNKEEYLSYLNPYFENQIFESCYNSIGGRKELFGIFKRKKG